MIRYRKKGRGYNNNSSCYRNINDNSHATLICRFQLVLFENFYHREYASSTSTNLVYREKYEGYLGRRIIPLVTRRRQMMLRDMKSA